MNAIRFVPERGRTKTVGRVLRLLEMAEHASRLRRIRRPSRQPGMPVRAGVSMVVPVRGTPDLLGRTLEAARDALRPVDEPTQIIVIVSESYGSEYRNLVQSYPDLEWMFRSDPLHYGQAVEYGLRSVKHDWVYLLNSDMQVHQQAITSVLPLRSPRTFSIGSRITMEDGSETETNWTGLRFPDGDAAEIVERNPAHLEQSSTALYVGGGSGLFRASLLRRFISSTNQYAPFYWEDVEWGTRAWLEGFESIFCPSSRAVHGHRRTVRRYYHVSEISRVFERNRLLFHMRNLPGVNRLRERLLALDEVSWRELLGRRPVCRILAARARAFGAPGNHQVLYDAGCISFE